MHAIGVTFRTAIVFDWNLFLLSFRINNDNGIVAAVI